MTPPRLRRTLTDLRLRAGAVAIAAALAAGCGSGSKAHEAASPVSPALGAVQIVPSVTHRTIHLPAPYAVSYDAGGRHTERAGAGPATLTLAHARNLIITSAPAALLLHRVAELHARLRPGQFPIGADVSDRLHLSSTYWTSGFWPGALWQAAALAPAHGMFARWALSATLAHLGHERQPTHDVGFMYGQSSLTAYRALCTSGRTAAALCSRLRRSVIAAANELVSLASGNARAGTIPTNPSGPRAVTIVDSMMNIQILPWATRLTGDRAYVRLAARHARQVARLLVRPDGSTIQAVNFDRASGRVLSFATHQGISRDSTWSRGEGWALYGFAQAAADLRDRPLLGVAERIAGYVTRHIPASGVLRWDYDAPAAAPVDVSAGVITSAGLLHLAAACRSLEPGCPQAGGWIGLSRRMLGAALGYASPEPPLGLLRGQLLNERARGCWCDGGELSFGLSYALEALRLVRTLHQGGVAVGAGA